MGHDINSQPFTNTLRSLPAEKGLIKLDRNYLAAFISNCVTQNRTTLHDFRNDESIKMFIETEF